MKRLCCLCFILPRLFGGGAHFPPLSSSVARHCPARCTSGVGKLSLLLTSLEVCSEEYETIRGACNFLLGIGWWDIRILGDEGERVLSESWFRLFGEENRSQVQLSAAQGIDL